MNNNVRKTYTKCYSFIFAVLLKETRPYKTNMRGEHMAVTCANVILSGA